MKNMLILCDIVGIEKIICMNHQWPKRDRTPGQSNVIAQPIEYIPNLHVTLGVMQKIF